MKKEVKFFYCTHCGNIVFLVNESGAPLSCCGDTMKEITANSKEAAVEKHIPVVTESGDKIEVKVGSVEHPMTPEHYIQWIFVEQNGKVQFQFLTPEDKPEAEFVVTPGVPYTVYEYCNLHGLWKNA